MLLVETDKIKRDKLRDIIRRVIANPQHVDEVVDEIALDWFPNIHVDQGGCIRVVVGSGVKQ